MQSGFIGTNVSRRAPAFRHIARQFPEIYYLCLIRTAAHDPRNALYGGGHGRFNEDSQLLEDSPDLLGCRAVRFRRLERGFQSFGRSALRFASCSAS
jgi:hypothetical protein